MDTFLVVAALGLGGYVAVQVARTKNALANQDADKIRCPHCQVLGSVTVKLTRKRNGIGGRAPSRPFTDGASMLVAGLSGRHAVRHLACSSCGMQWDAD